MPVWNGSGERVGWNCSRTPPSPWAVQGLSPWPEIPRVPGAAGVPMRASTSALDAEDQDQEETPIPGAHNCPPARLFYRTFPSYVYTFFSLAVRGLSRRLSLQWFPRE